MVALGQSSLALLLVIWTVTTSGQGCNETLTNSTGVIGIPNFPDPYPNNTSCWWHVIAPREQNILLIVSDLNTTCRYDMVRVHDGDSTRAPLLGEFCYLPKNSFLGVSSSELFITVTPEKSDVFNMKYLFYGADCNKHLTTSPGAIESPGYPDNYPANLACSWLIEAPRGQFILLDILNVETECGYDYVTVYDGYSINETYYQFCHIAERTLIASSSNFLYIIFGSDTTQTRQGFLVEYSFYDCNGVLNEPFGIINSPGYPHVYPNNFQCSWTIVAGKGQRIVLTLDNVHTECYYDYVYVYEGTNENSTLLGRFCQAKNVILESTYNALFIFFSSDLSVTEDGFNATYSFTVGTDN
ncbi:Deleted in malignant brain tumors 1 protein [Bulinus truncatus]|nr:Deleted in malignant brain tumors 1 protein [Bulinus truncatus]